MRSNPVCVFGLCCMFAVVVVSDIACEGERLEEPELVLPDVVLEIEDLRIEEVEAMVPFQDDLPVPQRVVPLPEAPQIEIEEPWIGAEPQLFDADRGGDLHFGPDSDIFIGLGVPDYFTGSSWVTQTAQFPRYQVRYFHESLGGAGTTPASAGYAESRESLDGSIAFQALGAEVSSTLRYVHAENGLQGRGADGLFSRNVRYGSGMFEVSIRPWDKFRIFGTVEAEASSLSFSMSSLSPSTEWGLAPGVGCDYELGWISGDLVCRYEYRQLLGSPVAGHHRLLTEASARGDLPFQLQIGGQLGLFLSSRSGVSVPFTLEVSGTPFPALSFMAAGGYFVQNINAHDVFVRTEPLTVPTVALVDNQGWYAEVGADFGMLEVLRFSTGVHFAVPSGMVGAGPVAATDVLPQPIVQTSAYTLSGDIDLWWDVTNSVTVHTGYTREFLERPEYEPRDDVRIDVTGTERSGSFGGSLSIRYQTGIVDIDQLPTVDLGGFFRPTDTVECGAELRDCLSPFLQNGKRYAWAWIVEPGFRAIAYLQIRP